jgi:hypothetical protein
MALTKMVISWEKKKPFQVNQKVFPTKRNALDTMEQHAQPINVQK